VAGRFTRFKRSSWRRKKPSYPTHGNPAFAGGGVQRLSWKWRKNVKAVEKNKERSRVAHTMRREGPLKNDFKRNGGEV